MQLQVLFLLCLSSLWISSRRVCSRAVPLGECYIEPLYLGQQSFLRFSGILFTVRHIVTTDGALGLWRGTMPTLLRYVISHLVSASASGLTEGMLAMCLALHFTYICSKLYDVLWRPYHTSLRRPSLHRPDPLFPAFQFQLIWPLGASVEWRLDSH